ncbi:MAG: type II toxin-antitoxin system prevent-host-death family antitoxin [Spirochaetia bacterium]|jgi:prevent-host-death family protein|nr:type II toxin-antitoxin system prevent-host-death family antitoxin [Spirochaetia bacterium]
MNSLTVGAFEAKTHFSQLLREVEKGNTIHITRRGKAIARILPEAANKEESGQDALERIAQRRNNLSLQHKTTTKEILEFRDEGRK